MRGIIAGCVIATLGITASNVAAQTERVRVSASVAGAMGSGGPAPAVSAGAGFKLATHAGFETELSFVPRQEFHGAGTAVPLVYPSAAPISFAERGRTILFLSSFVTDLNVGRIRPYAQFGVGMANVQRKTTVQGETAGGVTTTGGFVAVPGSSVSGVRSTNDLALGAGTGLDVAVLRRLSIAADLRYVYLPGDGIAQKALHITRIGTRLSWRF